MIQETLRTLREDVPVVRYRCFSVFVFGVWLHFPWWPLELNRCAKVYEIVVGLVCVLAILVSEVLI